MTKGKTRIMNRNEELFHRDETEDRNEYGVTAEVFIWAWETSETADAVVQKLADFAKKHGLPAMPKGIVLARASGYRNRTPPINLKKLRRSNSKTYDVEALNNYIDTLRHAQETGKTPEMPKVEPGLTPPVAEGEDAVKATIKKMMGGKATKK